MRELRLIGLGEVLWDMLPKGRQLGGAPANFAYHAGSLGASAGVISRVGNDQLGRGVMERFRSMGFAEDLIQVDEEAPTGTVTVELSGAGVPQFTIHENVAWDRLEITPAALRAVGKADAVCFGSLAQRGRVSRSAIRRLLAAAPAEALRIFDINLREPFYTPEIIRDSLELANVLKVNETELPVLKEWLGLSGEETTQLAQAAERHRLRAVAYTRGARGSLILADGRWSDHPGISVEVADTVGAGDAFTAAMALGLLAKWDVEQVNRRANEVAAYVASRCGATPELPQTLRQQFLEA